MIGDFIVGCRTVDTEEVEVTVFTSTLGNVDDDGRKERGLEIGASQEARCTPTRSEAENVAMTGLLCTNVAY